MGCDYYILKLLHIYYNDKEYLEVELDFKKGYFTDDDYDEDEDEEDYAEKMGEYINYMLTPKMKPIIIYINDIFSKLSFEIKYKTLVENEIAKHGKEWSEITKIIKVEERRDR